MVDDFDSISVDIALLFELLYESDITGHAIKTRGIAVSKVLQPPQYFVNTRFEKVFERIVKN